MPTGDTGDDYLGSHFHHGASFRRAVEEGLIDPKRVVQIGIRGSLSAADMWQFSYDSGMRVVSIEEFQDKGWRWAVEEARKVIGGGSAYLFGPRAWGTAVFIQDINSSSTICGQRCESFNIERDAPS